MGFTRKYIKERKFVLTLVRDRVNDKELCEHVRLLTAETVAMHPFLELADVSELHELSGITKLGTITAGTLEIDRKPHKADKLAVLVSSDEMYKMAAGYIATSFYYRYDARIFKDFRIAIEWLGVADLENEINKLRKE